MAKDSSYREVFNFEPLGGAEGAAKDDKVFLSGNAKGVLVLGISALGPEKAKRFIASCGGWKSHTNWALVALDGERGEIRKNKAGTCWVIDLASPRRTVLFAWTSGPREVRFAGPRLNTTNGGAHWCGLVSETLVLDAEKNRHTLAFLAQAKACMAEHGMTPNQWERVENARQSAEINRRIEVLKAASDAARADSAAYVFGGYGPQWGEDYRDAAFAIAGESGPVPENLAVLIREKIASVKLAAEEARLMAELEAEQARLAEEKAKADAEEKRQEEIAATCHVAGISPAEWEGMSEKKRRLTLHRARLAGKI